MELTAQICIVVNAIATAVALIVGSVGGVILKLQMNRLAADARKGNNVVQAQGVELSEKVDVIHGLADGNLSAIKADLATARQEIADLRERMIADAKTSIPAPAAIPA